jgi:hypothetical protein
MKEIEFTEEFNKKIKELDGFCKENGYELKIECILPDFVKLMSEKLSLEIKALSTYRIIFKKNG